MSPCVSRCHLSRDKSQVQNRDRPINLVYVPVHTEFRINLAVVVGFMRGNCPLPCVISARRDSPLLITVLLSFVRPGPFRSSCLLLRYKIRCMDGTMSGTTSQLTVHVSRGENGLTASFHESSLFPRKIKSGLSVCVCGSFASAFVAPLLATCSPGNVQSDRRPLIYENLRATDSDRLNVDASSASRRENTSDEHGPGVQSIRR